MSTNDNTNTYTTPNGVFEGQPPVAYNAPAYKPAQPAPVGGVILEDGDIEYNVNRRTVTLKVRNTGDRPVQVGSHYHFFEVNRYLEFDRKAAFGMRLNIPATTAVRFEPGEEKEVSLVEYGGKQRAIGFNNLVDGYTGYEDTPTFYPKKIEAFRLMDEYGFKNVTAEEADAEFTAPAPKAAPKK